MKTLTIFEMTKGQSWRLWRLGHVEKMKGNSRQGSQRTSQCVHDGLSVSPLDLCSSIVDLGCHWAQVGEDVRQTRIPWPRTLGRVFSHCSSQTTDGSARRMRKLMQMRPLEVDLFFSCPLNCLFLSLFHGSCPASQRFTTLLQVDTEILRGVPFHKALRQPSLLLWPSI